MLRELVRYATERGLEAEPGFTLGKEVHWALEFSALGAFLGAVRLGTPDEKGKIKGGRRVARAPEMKQGDIVAGAGERRCQPIVESADVVVGLGFAGETAADVEKSRGKRAWYLARLASLAEVMPLAAPVHRALSDPDSAEHIANALSAKGAKPTDKVCAAVDGVLLVDRPEWIPWWRDQYARLRSHGGASADAAPMICLATGEAVIPAPTHSPIRGLRGAIPTGALLVSFDKNPYQSYGLSKSNNAAVSPEAVAAYAAALQDLLRTQSSRLGEATVLHWYRGAETLEDDPLSFLSNPDPEGATLGRVRSLHSAIESGERHDLLTATYYALTLSGMSARVMVREWQTGSFAALVSAVLEWFDDLQLVSPFGGFTAPPQFWMVLQATGIKTGADTFDPAPPAVATRLWGAAMGGRHVPIPRAALNAAVLHERAYIIGNGPKPGPMRATRLGLMRAFHNRSPKGVPMSIGLDSQHPDPAYHCGRLLAVLADLQEAALGDVGAGVVSRFYASASSTPALVFGRILRTSQHHLAKLEGGRAHWYNGHIAATTTSISAMPRTLDLERQSLFALGYYHQIAADRLARAEKKAAKQATPTAAPPSGVQS